MSSGAAQFALPEFDHLPYINISKYNHFGFIDLVASSLKNDFPISEWWANYPLLKRDFSIRAAKKTEVFYLTFDSLASLQEQAPADFSSIFGQISVRYARTVAQRVKIEKECRAHCGTDPEAKSRLRKEYTFEVVNLDSSVVKEALMSRHKMLKLKKLSCVWK